MKFKRRKVTGTKRHRLVDELNLARNKMALAQHEHGVNSQQYEIAAADFNAAMKKLQDYDAATE